MGIVLDLILLVILVLSIVMGYKKGLIGVVFSFCAFIVSIIVTIILYNPISNLVIKNTQLDDNLKNVIIENGIVKEENDENTSENFIDKYVSKFVTETKNNVVENTAGILAEKVVAIGVAIVLFIVVRIALIFLKFIIEGVASLPIIKQFNKFGGVLYGVLRGAIVIYAILAIMFFINSLANSEFITTLINTSFISKFLYVNNLILQIIF